MRVDPMFIVFCVVFFGGLAFAAYRVVTMGFWGASLGFDLGRTRGEVAFESNRWASGTIRVHSVAEANGKRVGIEVVEKRGLSRRTIPVILSKQDALALADLLRRGAEDA